ncbi:MAG: FAD-dependent oxidoreductase [Proteobacteria bacterium]|nr:FAD-dependent oxidoreductase [Pseudomonadota bacterium]
MEKIVVIGAVAAGPKTACHAKRLMPEADILLIDQDNLISYGGCGIPYYIGGEVGDETALRSTSFHAVRDEVFFHEAKGLRVKIKTKVLSINREARTILVEDIATRKQEEIPYDKLVIATGSQPNLIPIKGLSSKGVFTIGSLHSAMGVQKWLSKDGVNNVVVVGGGAIGIEMAEGIEDMWGLDTTIVEYMPQLLPNIIDWQFAEMLKQHLEENNVKVFTGEAVTAIKADENGLVKSVITDKRTLEADLVIMAAGVRPRDQLAKEAGLHVAPKGGIVVNNRMQTSDPNIYAAGDCVESLNLVSGKRMFAPLGSLANRQGRVVGDNLAGIPSTFNGITGSFIMKAFETCVGSTGLSYQAALAEGFDAEQVITIQSDRAHFLPNQENMPLIMVVDKSNRKVLGVQGFGPMGDGVMARINAAAGLLAKNAVIEDFSNLEMAYAPPFSTAVDALNATANVADNLVRGRFRQDSIKGFIEWLKDPSRKPEWIALDTRSNSDSQPFRDAYGERWLNIPYPEMRARYQELPKEKELIIICGAGTRSYEVQIFLDSVGYTNTKVLGGGLMVLRRLGLVDLPG